MCIIVDANRLGALLSDPGTGDRDLIEDFKDKQFIDRPRGKVYTRAANAKLLAAAACAARAR